MENNNSPLYAKAEFLLNDLHNLLDTQAGKRFFAHFLYTLGFGQEIELQDIQAQVSKNIAEALVSKIAEAHPQTALECMAKIYITKTNIIKKEE